MHRTKTCLTIIKISFQKMAKKILQKYSEFRYKKLVWAKKNPKKINIRDLTVNWCRSRDSFEEFLGKKLLKELWDHHFRKSLFESNTVTFKNSDHYSEWVSVNSNNYKYLKTYAILGKQFAPSFQLFLNCNCCKNKKC